MAGVEKPSLTDRKGVLCNVTRDGRIVTRRNARLTSDDLN